MHEADDQSSQHDEQGEPRDQAIQENGSSEHAIAPRKLPHKDPWSRKRSLHRTQSRAPSRDWVPGRTDDLLTRKAPRLAYGCDGEPFRLAISRSARHGDQTGPDT